MPPRSVRLGASPFEPAPGESFLFAMEEGNSGGRENWPPRGASKVRLQSSFSLIGVISSIDSYCRHYFCETSGCLAQCRGLRTVDPRIKDCRRFAATFAVGTLS